MQVEVTPPLAGPEQRALLAALEQAEVGEPEPDLYVQAWRLAALQESEAVERDEDYAFSPRSTRGATRA